MPLKPLALCLLTISAITTTAAAQQPPTPPGPPTPPRPMVLKGERHLDINIPTYTFDLGPQYNIAPSGTWWRSPDTIQALNLTPDQQRKMDDIFRQNRIQLVHLKASLEEAQINLEPILNTNPPDTARALVEINKIADLRADLEKANAKMLLSLRNVLTGDQWPKLQAMHPNRGGFSSDFFKEKVMKQSSTTCIQNNADSSPHCTTTTGQLIEPAFQLALPRARQPKDDAFDLAVPRDPNHPAPPSFTISTP